MAGSFLAAARAETEADPSGLHSGMGDWLQRDGYAVILSDFYHLKCVFP